MRHDSAYSRFGAGLATVLALLLTLAASAAPARAEDVYAEMLQRYDEVNAELERAIHEIENGVDAAPAPKRVLSLNNNASVTIGGEIRTTYAYADSSGETPGFEPGAGDRDFSMKTGDFAISTARISVDARMGDRWRAFVDLNMYDSGSFHSLRDTVNPNDPGAPEGGALSTDYGRRNATPYPYINQAYVEFMKGDHSGFGGIVGLVKLPFGLWQRPNLFAKSFLDSPDLTGSYLMQAEGWAGGMRLPHASRFVDPAVAAMLYYEMRDIVRFDAAVFQESDAEENVIADGRGKTRSDEVAPRSWQIGASIQPLDGWELTAHFRNRYSRSRGIGYWANSPGRWDFRANRASGGGNDPSWDPAEEQWSDAGTGEGFGSTSNEQALVVGVAAEIPGTKLAASVEYAHGWNQGFNKYINSDSVNVGLSYELTPRLTLYAQGEWLHVKDRSWMAESAPGAWKRDTRNNHLYRAMLGAEYELADYLTLEAGWQYEYWKARAAVLGEESLVTANMLYFGTRLVF